MSPNLYFYCAVSLTPDYRSLRWLHESPTTTNGDKMKSGIKIIGIDPGSVSGAFAILTDECAFVDDLPTVDKGLNAPELARLFRAELPFTAVLERVSAMPKQGVSSSFNFGRAYGTIIGVLAALEVPTILVTPTVWKGHFRLTGKDRDRDAGRELAIRLYPEVAGLARKKDGGRADALLIARWFKGVS